MDRGLQGHLGQSCRKTQRFTWQIGRSLNDMISLVAQASGILTRRAVKP